MTVSDNKTLSAQEPSTLVGMVQEERGSEKFVSFDNICFIYFYSLKLCLKQLKLCVAI